MSLVSKGTIPSKRPTRSVLVFWELSKSGGENFPDVKWKLGSWATTMALHKLRSGGYKFNRSEQSQPSPQTQYV